MTTTEPATTDGGWGVLAWDPKKTKIKDVPAVVKGKKTVVTPVTLIDGAAGIQDPLSDPETWDRCILGGIELVGLSDVKIKRARKIDVKKSAGTDGASTTDHGYDPANVEIIWRFNFLWPGHPSKEEQFALAMAALAKLEPKADKEKRPPLSIKHPVASFRRVKSIIIKEIDGPDIDKMSKLHTIKIHAIEWRPAPPAGKSTTNTPLSAKDAKAFKKLAEKMVSDMEDLTATADGITKVYNPKAFDKRLGKTKDGKARDVILARGKDGKLTGLEIVSDSPPDEALGEGTDRWGGDALGGDSLPGKRKPESEKKTLDKKRRGLG